jgi:phosphoglycerate dehydrogenase-like enzyme
LTEKIYITSDFSSNLWMFNLGSIQIKKIKKLFPQIELVVIDVNNKKINLNDKTIIYWGTRINSTILKKLPKLKWIHFGSVGTDKIKLNDLKNKKIIITNSKNINTYSITNLILMYLFDINRRILINKKNFSSRKGYEKKFHLTKDIANSKILICGYGNISKSLIKIFDKLKLNYEILSNQEIKSKRIKSYKYKKLNNIIQKYDIIINNLSSNIETQEMFDNTIFNKMQINASIISIGRLNVFKPSSLNKFFKRNSNASLYIDMPEKDISQKDLLGMNKLNNVYISPHIGGYSKSYWDNEVQLFIRNLKLFLSNKKLINIVNKNKRNFS